MDILLSLRNRIFLATALLAVVSIGVAVYVVNASVTHQAELEMRRGLEEAGTLVEEYRALRFGHFAREARLIADLPKLKAAVSENDPETARPVVSGYREQIGAEFVLVTNRRGDVLADIGGSNLDASTLRRHPSIRTALTGGEMLSYWPRPSGVWQVVSVPIFIGLAQPEVLGTLSVGSSLDDAVAQRFKELTQREIAFASDGVVRATTLPAVYREQLAGLLRPDAPQNVWLGTEEYVALVRPLTIDHPSRPGGVVSAAASASGSSPVAIVLESRTKRLGFLRSLHATLAVTALFAVLTATLLSYAISRTVTRPLAAITNAMRQMAADGDLTRRLVLPAGGRWDDEDARLLARTFNTMTESIARFQREARQRERLSALGRLSTVIAHEVRNPLMIIKTALRRLRRSDGPPPLVTAAIDDIDEEVVRLNRIVTEVLDFARPIRFEYAPVELNALCQDAVAAAQGGRLTSEISLDLDASVPSVITDRERLRLALVNVVSNAVDAVAARPDREASSGPLVFVTTRRADPTTVSIRIRDLGVGIAPDDLPRVFEPYFTTKRTGSGLGLAIAKNIVEGLEGTILARSAEAGTEFVVELPVRPSHGEHATGPAEECAKKPPGFGLPASGFGKNLPSLDPEA